jgi:PAS domain S-box-containing protein
LSWISIIWSLSASACLMLALVHLAVWWQRREAHAHGWFALLALGTLAVLVCELEMMRAGTPDEFGRVLWWSQPPAFVVTVSLIGFVRVYLRAGRMWLALVVCGLRAGAFILNLFSWPNINFREITNLRHIQFLGEPIVVAEGVRNPWMLVGQAGLLLTVVFVVDAMVTVWRRGGHWRARWLSVAITFFVCAVTVQVLLIFWGNFPMPYTASLFFWSVVMAMGLDLSWDVIRATKLDEDLKASERRFRQLTEAAFEGICLSENGRVCAINDQGLKMLGYDREEIVGRAIAELVAPESRELVAEAIRSGREGLYEHQLLRKDGAKLLVETQAKMARVGNRTVRMTALRDITERKRAEATLSALALRHQTLLQTAREGIHVLDERGRVVEANAAFGAMLGYSRDEMLRLSVMDWDVQWSREELLAKIGTLMEHPAQFETRQRRKDGSVIDVEISAVSVLLEGRRYLYNSARDITERKRAETLANGQKQVLEMIAGDAPTPDVLVALLRVIESASQAMLGSILLLDRDGLHLRHGAAPSLPAAYCQAIDGLAIGPNEGSCGTAAYRREPVLVEDIATDPLWANYRAMALPHGLRACWSTPMFDAQQNVLGTFAIYYRQPGLPSPEHRHLIEVATHTAAIAIGRQRAKAALQESEARFRQSQKMEGIGQLAGGVAHDFNNILSALLMQTDLLATVEPLPEEVRAGLREIRGDVRRAAELTRQLLLFSRRQVMQLRRLNLNDLVMNLGKMLQRIIGEDIQLQLHLHPGALPTRADAGMLEQVLMNLCVNARDAMPGGGWLLINTTEAVVDEARARAQAEATPGRYVCLSVSDTGKGIPPEILPKIFEPFFTTKEAGKGTGLGLATVFGIVKQHQGWIQVDNRPGQGVTFQIFLPANAEETVEGPAAPLPPQSPGGTETILLVEDEASVRKLTRKVLERQGYKIVEACNGVEALRRWEEHRGSVALLLTDLVMPGGISGQELAKQLVGRQPTLKVIYTSGYSAEMAGRALQLRRGETFVQKPYPTGQLLETIRRSLDG